MEIVLYDEKQGVICDTEAETITLNAVRNWKDFLILTRKKDGKIAIKKETDSSLNFFYNEVKEKEKHLLAYYKEDEQCLIHIYSKDGIYCQNFIEVDIIPGTAMGSKKNIVLGILADGSLQYIDFENQLTHCISTNCESYTIMYEYFNILNKGVMLKVKERDKKEYEVKVDIWDENLIFISNNEVSRLYDITKALCVIETEYLADRVELENSKHNLICELEIIKFYQKGCCTEIYDGKTYQRLFGKVESYINQKDTIKEVPIKIPLYIYIEFIMHSNSVVALLGATIEDGKECNYLQTEKQLIFLGHERIELCENSYSEKYVVLPTAGNETIVLWNHNGMLEWGEKIFGYSNIETLEDGILMLTCKYGSEYLYIENVIFGKIKNIFRDEKFADLYAARKIREGDVSYQLPCTNQRFKIDWEEKRAYSMKHPRYWIIWLKEKFKKQ